LVAKQERINPITVSKAYQMLVDEGLLEKKRGLGMFVGSGAQARALEQERVRFLEDEWPQLRRRLAALQLDLHALVELDDKAGA
jgi:GntR family transcriptional regulator